ncbi:MFS transporter, partial [Alicyclobacillus suci]|uniref:MFS transporter n=1 Tax=Alicyclobacillus suci TaxID=2816080 RepID=UPI001A8E2497
DVLGPRRSAILGSLVWAMSTEISALAPNLLVMLVARTLLGLAEGYTWPVANSLTARWFPLSERGRAKAVWLSATCIGPGVSGYIVGSCLTV